jgi:DNA-binding NarL/FixJ family response regulator
MTIEDCEAAIAHTLGLTTTEARVACACVEVPDVARVAAVVGISTHTVHTHLSRIYLKAKVNSRLQLAVLVTAALWRIASRR